MTRFACCESISVSLSALFLKRLLTVSQFPDFFLIVDSMIEMETRGKFSLNMYASAFQYEYDKTSPGKILFVTGVSSEEMHYFIVHICLCRVLCFALA